LLSLQSLFALGVVEDKFEEDFIADEDAAANNDDDAVLFLAAGVAIEVARVLLVAPS
jgi:hypothetical protein